MEGVEQVKSQLAIALYKYLYGKGYFLWASWPGVVEHNKARTMNAWLDGVTYGVTASVDTRSKVPAPGWMKGRP